MHRVDFDQFFFHARWRFFIRHILWKANILWEMFYRDTVLFCVNKKCCIYIHAQNPKAKIINSVRIKKSERVQCAAVETRDDGSVRSCKFNLQTIDLDLIINCRLSYIFFRTFNHFIVVAFVIWRMEISGYFNRE